MFTNKEGKKCPCGSNRFYAHQRSYHDVIVTSDNIFSEDKGIYESDDPYGPYVYVDCGASFDDLADL